MEPARNQPPGNGLREALAPWFDHAAAWAVLLCAGLAALATLAGYAPGASRNGLITVLATAAATAAAIAVIRRAGRLPDLEAGSTRRLALALVCTRRPAGGHARLHRGALPRLAGGAGRRQHPEIRLLPLRGHRRRRHAAVDARQVARTAILARVAARGALRRRRPVARDAARVRAGRRVLGRDAGRHRHRAGLGPAAAPLGLEGLAGARDLRAGPDLDVGLGAARVHHDRGRRHAEGRLSAARAGDRRLRRRGASRLPAHRAPCAADRCRRTRLAARRADAIRGADAGGMHAARAALGKLRRSGGADRLGRLHRRGPPVRAPGDRDRPHGRHADRPGEALRRGAVLGADPQYQRRHRDRRLRRPDQLPDADRRADFRAAGPGADRPAAGGSGRLRGPAAAAGIPAARPRAGRRLRECRGAHSARRRQVPHRRDPRHEHGRGARDRRAPAEPARHDRPQGHGGAAQAPRAARSADAAREPLAVPRPAGARGRGQQAQRPRRRRDVRRSRQLQEDQRLVRPRARRSRAEQERAAPRQGHAQRRHRRAPRRRRVRGAAREPDRQAAGGRDRGSHRRGAAGAARPAGHGHARCGERGRRLRDRRRRRRGTDAQRRHRDVFGQGAGQGPLHGLRTGHAARGQQAPGDRDRTRAGADGGAVPAALPADHRTAFRLPARRRGAGALEAPEARPARSLRVHRGCRGVGTDRPARPLGTGAGLPGSEGLAGAPAGGPPGARRRQRLGGAAHAVGHLRRRREGARDFRHRSGLPRDRADRERADAEQR